jgi:hypothetical protein
MKLDDSGGISAQAQIAKGGGIFLFGIGGFRGKCQTSRSRLKF